MIRVGVAWLAVCLVSAVTVVSLYWFVTVGQLRFDMVEAFVLGLLVPLAALWVASGRLRSREGRWVLWLYALLLSSLAMVPLVASGSRNVAHLIVSWTAYSVGYLCAALLAGLVARPLQRSLSVADSSQTRT